MLGLQTQHDIQNISRITSSASASTGASQGRSYKFAKQLSQAGFAVVGLTNSMEKHTQREKKEALSQERKVNLNSKLAQEQFIQKQDLETQSDAQRLAELEAQLADIKHKKELRRQRDRERRRRRREFMAACIIQRALKYFLKVKLVQWANTIRHFVIKVKNRNALTVGAWAAQTIRKFAEVTTTRWHEERMRRLALELAARQRREQERRLAAIEINIRSTMSKSLVMSTLRTCMVSVAKKEIAARREASRAAREKQWKRGTKKASHAVNTVNAVKSAKDIKMTKNATSEVTTLDSPASNDEDASQGAFYLTSTGQAEADQDDDGESYENEHKQYVAANHVPALNADRRGAFHVSHTDEDVATFDMLSEDIGLDLLPDDGYDEDAMIEAERKARLADAHREREQAMQREREQRLKALAKKKAIEAELARQQAETERREREAREQARLDWLEQQEDATLARAQYITKKRKQAEKDVKKAIKEMQLMAQEDLWTIEREKRRKALETFIPRRPKRRPRPEREKSEFELEAEELERKEQEEAKIKAAEELAERSKKALEMRLQQRREQEEKQKLAEEAASRMKVDKINQLEEARKAALLKAMEAKKLAEANRRQLAKERAARDAADKIDAPQEGRTHNAFGKPLGVKGFIRERVDSRGELRKKNSHNKYPDSNMPPTHLPAQDPSVIEWNYNFFAMEHSNEPLASSSTHSSKDSPSLKAFDEFLLDAKSHQIAQLPDTFQDQDSSYLVHRDSISNNQEKGKEKEYWPFGEESNDEDDEQIAMETKNAENIVGDDAQCRSQNPATNASITPENKSGNHVPTSVSSADSMTTKESSNAGKTTEQENIGIEGLDTTGKGKKHKRKAQALKDKAITLPAHINIAADPSKAQGPVPIIPDKKMPISQIMGTSHIRDNIKIPTALKDTPYFKAYAHIKGKPSKENKDKSNNKYLHSNVESDLQSVSTAFVLDTLPVHVPAPETVPSGEVISNGMTSFGLENAHVYLPTPDLMSPLDLAPPSKHPLLAAQTLALRASGSSSLQPSKKTIFFKNKHVIKPPGKVATLHTMIAQARNVVDSKASMELRSSITGFPNVEFVYPPTELNIEIEEAVASDSHLRTHTGEPLTGSLQDYFILKANQSMDESNGNNITPSVLEAAKEGKEHFPLPKGTPRNNQRVYEMQADSEDDEEEEDSAQRREEQRQEDKLNEECDRLRLRLEAKLGTSGKLLPTESSDPPIRNELQPCDEMQPNIAASKPILNNAYNTVQMPISKSDVAASFKLLKGLDPKIVPPPKKPLRAQDILANHSKQHDVTQNLGSYAIGIDVPDFSYNLIKQWAQEDAEENSPTSHAT